MTILTKEGNVYVLSGPNPLVEKQVVWDLSRLIFHNFQWGEISHSTPRKGQGARKQEESALAARTPESPRAEVVPLRPGPAVAPQSETLGGAREPDLPFIKYKVLCHCLPAKSEIKHDPLYGESWSRVSYGNKFVFPCIVMSSGDLLLEFWTSDPNEQINENSIIYPFSYEVHNSETNGHDRVPYDDYRWWRVSKRESREGGWLLSASPSDHQPDFSD